MRRTSRAAAVIVVATLLAGCASVEAGGSPSATPTPGWDDLCAEALVVRCDIFDGGSVITLDADGERPGIVDLAMRVAERAAIVAPGGVTVRGASSATTQLDPEVAPPPAWEVSTAVDDFDAQLGEVLDAAAVPGATGIVVIDGWPSVTVQTIREFADVFHALSDGPLFEGGGTYTLRSLDEHLRIVHVPAHTPDLVVEEIIDIAQQHPDAEVLLEAPTAGPQRPTFYVSHLTEAEALALAVRLDDPRLAGADLDGYPVEYVLGWMGESGTTYLSGTFGAVPG